MTPDQLNPYNRALLDDLSAYSCAKLLREKAPLCMGINMLLRCTPSKEAAAEIEEAIKYLQFLKEEKERCNARKRTYTARKRNKR